MLRRLDYHREKACRNRYLTRCLASDTPVVEAVLLARGPLHVLALSKLTGLPLSRVKLVLRIGLRGRTFA